jgi:hypothetical protein
LITIILQVGSSHIGDAEDDGEEEAEYTNDDVAVGEEIVLASQSIGSGKNKPFLSLEGANLIIVCDGHLILSLLKIFVNLTPKLSEVGKTGGSHPNDEVLILHVVPLDIFEAFCSHSCRELLDIDIFEFVSQITRPGDVLLTDWDGSAVGLLQHVGIVED